MESFVPGTLERLGLGWDVLQALAPAADPRCAFPGGDRPGPRASGPGFGTLIEAASGFAAMNGEPDGAPIVPSFPLADMTLGALRDQRHHVRAVSPRRARRRRAGASTCRCSNRCSRCSGRCRPSTRRLAACARATAAVRRTRGRAAVIRTQRRPLDCRQRLHAEDGRAVPARLRARAPAGRSAVRDQRGARAHTPRARRGHRRAPSPPARSTRTSRSSTRHQLTAVPVQTVADIEQDPHWQSRGLFTTAPGPRGDVPMHAVDPAALRDPRRVHWAGGTLGQHNRQVYGEELGLSAGEIERLQAEGVI